MLAAFLQLLTCQFFGAVLVHLLDWPVPGPVMGLFLLLLWLVLAQALASRRRSRQSSPDNTALTELANALLRFLTLMFVPAAVGVMVHGEILAEQGLRVLFVMVVSTVVALLVTGWSMQFLLRWQFDREQRRTIIEPSPSTKQDAG